MRPDNHKSAAIEERFSQLEPGDQAIIDECAKTLKNGVKNMGQRTAVEVLYQVGRLLAIHEKETQTHV